MTAVRFAAAALATSWKMVDARTWRFSWPPNFRFRDGMPMTADDVVLPIERALSQISQRALQPRGVPGARKVDPLTVGVLLSAPDAVLPDKLVFIRIMSEAWAESMASRSRRTSTPGRRPTPFATRMAPGRSC